MVGRPQTSSPDPWRWPVTVAQIPDSGLDVTLEATPAQREALAKVARLPEIFSAGASFRLSHAAGGKVHVVGRVTARVGQTCVVTLEPIENVIDERVDLEFAPEEDIPRLAAIIDAEDDAGEVPDLPEPISNGTIDLGRVATDVLFLAIDPYPRKPGAVFTQPQATRDSDEHPFAALKALQRGGKPRGSSDD